MEILSLSRIVTNQFSNLIKTMPKPNFLSSVELQTDYDLFKKAIMNSFGKIVAENAAQCESATEIADGV